MEASSAKYYATEVAQRVVDQSLQIHGGIGLNKKSRIEYLYRAVRAPRIYEGTSEIQLLVVGRELFRGQSLVHDNRL
jgi:alkylation response protein AidB-like acyl-CoA dehydrogenase